MRHSPVRLVLAGRIAALVATSVLASGCVGPQATAKGTWAEGASRGQSFHKVLIVGVSPDLNQRCAFERFMASRLGTESTIAIASCSVTDRKEQLTRDSIVAAVAAQQVDAVLATRLVSRDWGAQEGGSSDTRGNAGYKATDAGWATGYYGTYGVPVIYGDFQANAAAVTLQGDVQISSRLFETKGAKLVYTLDTHASKIESTDAGLSLVADAIASRLRNDGLTR